MGVGRVSLNGRELRELREAIGLHRQAFAELLGVALSTVYRWESAGDHPARMEPGVQRLLEAARVFRELTARGRSNVDLPRAIAIGGGLFGLYVMLAAVLGVTGFGSVGVRALERAVSSRP